MHVTLYL